MALSEYKPKLETIAFDGGEFTVRGLSLFDVAFLIEVHEPTISTIFDLVQSRKDMFNSEDEDQVREAMTDLISSLVRESPILVANLISILSDEPGTTDQASKLLATVTVDALTKIVGLSFTDMAAVKKLYADVMTLVRGMIPTATARAA